MSFDIKGQLKDIAKMRCRELRKNQTTAEKVFWEIVRDNRLNNMKFYRQYPIFYCYNERESFFVADFYCHSKKLVVEVDGEIHLYQKEHDDLRTEIINMPGIEVLRINNAEILKDEDTVRKKLFQMLKV